MELSKYNRREFLKSVGLTTDVLSLGVRGSKPTAGPQTKSDQ